MHNTTHLLYHIYPRASAVDDDPLMPVFPEPDVQGIGGPCYKFPFPGVADASVKSWVVGKRVLYFADVL